MKILNFNLKTGILTGLLIATTAFSPLIAQSLSGFNEFGIKKRNHYSYTYLSETDDKVYMLESNIAFMSDIIQNHYVVIDKKNKTAERKELNLEHTLYTDEIVVKDINNNIHVVCRAKLKDHEKDFGVVSNIYNEDIELINTEVLVKTSNKEDLNNLGFSFSNNGTYMGVHSVKSIFVYKGYEKHYTQKTDYDRIFGSTTLNNGGMLVVGEKKEGLVLEKISSENEDENEVENLNFMINDINFIQMKLVPQNDSVVSVIVATGNKSRTGHFIGKELFALEVNSNKLEIIKNKRITFTEDILNAVGNKDNEIKYLALEKIHNHNGNTFILLNRSYSTYSQGGHGYYQGKEKIVVALHANGKVYQRLITGCSANSIIVYDNKYVAKPHLIFNNNHVYLFCHYGSNKKFKTFSHKMSPELEVIDKKEFTRLDTKSHLDFSNPVQLGPNEYMIFGKYNTKDLGYSILKFRE